MLLTVYERKVKDFVKKFFTGMAAGRNEAIHWDVEGLSTAVPVVDRHELVEELTKLGVDIFKFPDLFKSKYLFRSAMELLDNDASDKEKLELQEDIQEAVEAGDFQALEAEEAFAAGNKMAKTNLSGGSPSGPSKPAMPSSPAEVDPTTMHDRSVSTAGVAQSVMNQLKPDYDRQLLSWVPAAHWLQMEVRLDSIDDSNRANWEASKDSAKVDSMSQAMKEGWSKSVVLVNEPNASKLQLIDGHHRFLAAEQNGATTLPAYVAYVGGVDGQWKEMHDLQKQGSASSEADSQPLRGSAGGASKQGSSSSLQTSARRAIAQKQASEQQ